jgi:hypothetical protein
MKKIPKVLLLLILAVFLMAGSATATPTTVYDSGSSINYVGADNHGYGDVIGNTNDFEISKAVVEINGNTLRVDIYTNFAGKADLGLFSGYTKDGKGIGYGDLFLSSTWAPYGSPSYLEDYNVNGTTWSYGFALDNRWWDGTGTTYGFGALYSITNTDILLSDDLMSGATYRNGQEVAVDITGLTSVATGSWSIDETNNFISFLVDISGTGLIMGDEIAFHWGMTCANDVIEGSVPVPEPATMLLLGSGLIGLAGLGRKKFKKK